MFKDSKAFSSFSVDDIAKAKDFYVRVLGLPVEESPMGLDISLANGGLVFVYPKGQAHQPASHTVLNFPVANVDQAVDYLNEQGVVMEQLKDGPMQTDEKGIVRTDDPQTHGPDIAWFKDPAGNTLSVLGQQ